MRARLNLASSPLGNSRRFFLLAAIVGLPAIFLFGVLCAKIARDRALTGARREEISRIEGEMNGYNAQRRDLEAFFADPSTRAVTQRAAFLNALIDQRSFPWTQFFVDLERRLPAGVRVIALNPEISGDRVRIRMRIGALSDKSKLEFLRGLETAPDFSDIQVVSESRPAKSSEEHDVAQVDLTADYRPVAPLRPAREGSGQ